MGLSNETPPGMAGFAKLVPGRNIREVATNCAPNQAEILSGIPDKKPKRHRVTKTALVKQLAQSRPAAGGAA